MLRFLGIGAQKCGTTWLHAALSRHPKIYFPGGKELHFWDQHHDEIVLKKYQELFVETNRVEGDITPAYAFLSPKVIREVADHYPDLRLIYIIRDPRERAWSSARMALRRAEMEHDEASDQWFIDHFRSRGSLARGDYETCIRNWRAVFGFERLLILRFEEIASDSVAFVNRCLRHVGVESELFTEADSPSLQVKQFEGDGEPIRPSLLPLLNAIYSTKVDSLGRYLVQDLSTWTK